MAMAHLTEKQYQDLRKYIRALADRMELRDWTIILGEEATREGADASMFCTYGAKVVTILVGRNWNSLTSERQRAVIVHELVHAHFYPWQWAYNNLQYSVNQDIFKAVRGGITDAEEYAVQAITDIIARHMPLPGSPNRISIPKMDAEEKIRGIVDRRPPDLGECDHSKD